MEMKTLTRTEKDAKTKPSNDLKKHKGEDDRKPSNFLNTKAKQNKTRIATMNVDTLRTKESMDRLTQHLHNQRIDIACIQETHNERTDAVASLEYTIYFGGNDTRNETIPTQDDNTRRAGVAIAIKNSLIPNVKGIYKTNGRIMEIRIKTGNSIKNISILNTYAPHVGYPAETIKQYWDMVNAYISLIPNNLIRLWCTDNNGQLSKTDNNNIGPWALGGKLENLSSVNLAECCDRYDWVASSAHFIPKLK